MNKISNIPFRDRVFDKVASKYPLFREYKEAPKKTIWLSSLENFVYGFAGSVLVVFIAQEQDIAVLLGYMFYYFYVGKVINRPKYVTSLGKFIVFPIPTSMGAFSGYKLAYLLTEILQNT